MAIVVGVLFSTGIYLLMSRSAVRVLYGVVILGNGANLLIFTAAGLTRGNPPLVGPNQLVPESGHVDPLPQALVLTAIVIGFAVTAFAAVLLRKAVETDDRDDVDGGVSHE